MAKFISLRPAATGAVLCFAAWISAARAQTPVAAISDDGRVYAAHSDASGAFSGWTQPFSLGTSTERGIAIDYFDADGYPDIVVARVSGADMTFLKIPGMPGGAYGAPIVLGTAAAGGGYLMDMASGDFNGDGVADFIANANSTTVVFGMSNASGGFDLTLQNLETGTGRGMDAGDFNVDGKLDFVRARGGDGQVSLYLGDGAGHFAFLRTLGGLGGDPYGLAAADFDSDGKLDVLGNDGGGGNLTLFRGNGDGTFQAGTHPAGADRNNYTALDAFDYNGDGWMDLVEADYSGQSVYFYPGIGGGNFGEGVRINPGSPSAGNLLGIATLPSRHPRAPIAKIDPAVQTSAAGAAAHFDGSGSLAPVAPIVARDWGFGDGSNGSGVAVDHTYAAKGRYWASLKTVDAGGMADLAKALAIVTGPPPEAHAGGPYVFREDRALNGVWTGTLDGSATAQDGGDGARYVWNFMPDLSEGEDFGGGLDGARWQSAGTTVQDGSLRVGSTSLGSWGASYFASRQSWSRREGMTLYLRFLSHASENIMFGFKDTTANQSYPALQYAFYVAGTGLYIYEAGNSRGYVRGLAYATWYDFKIELTAAGADYWYRPGPNQAWERVYQSAFAGQPNLRIGISGYYQGQNEFDDFYLGDREEGRQVVHAFRGPGVFPVTLTVTDFLGQSDTDSTNVTTAGDALPVAHAGAPYLFGEAAAASGQWVARFDGRGSTDDYGIAEYRWDFGDGATGAGPQPEHTYAGRGPYLATLTVRDNAGQTATDAGPVSFQAANPPVAAFTAPASVDESAARNHVWTAAFDASPSTDDFGIWRYEWDFGDGGTALGRNPTHGFSDTGTYHVTLTVRDNAGQAGAIAHDIRIARNQPPVARITAPARVDEAAARFRKWTVAFSSAASTDDFGIWKVQWDFGDGSQSAETAPTHPFGALGTYAVRLTVFDHAGQAHTATQDLVVAANDPPVAVIAGPSATIEGAHEAAFDASGSSDDFGIARYDWDFGERIFDFAGTALDPLAWTFSPNLIQDGKLVVTGTGSWGARYLYGNRLMGRRSEIRARVKTPSTRPAYMMIGFKNATPGGDYTTFPHAVYFNDGTLYVYENGSSRGVVGSYTRGSEYEMRVVAGETGAAYSIRPAGQSAWTVLYTGTAVADSLLAPGLTVHSGAWEVDDLAVHGFRTGVASSWEFSAPTDVALTVTDHAGQAATAAWHVAVDTGAPPVARIQAPARYGVGLEVPFSAQGSSDDHGIAAYDWDFGDGSAHGTGPAAAHFYAASGVYTVRLTVTDFAGQAASASQAVEITGQNLVRTVPWRFNGGIQVPHEVWEGKPVTLKGVANTAPRPLSWSWDFGDGSAPATGTAATEAEAYAIEAEHAYSGSPGTPYVATLTVTDAGGTVSSAGYPLILKDSTLTTRTNVAIDEALWYLHKAQARSLSGSVRLGSWITYANYHTAVTAAAVQAFEINGHLPGGDPAVDPYVETARAGLDYLLTLVKYYNIGAQPYGDPDANGNGIGLGGTESDEPYQMGAVMDALIASGAPGALARTGGTNVRGRRYFDLVQDMADMYAWGQEDAGYGQGGWRYGWHGGADNSAAQWGAIGLLPAEHLWGVTVPAFVKRQNKVWTDYSYYNVPSNCGFGYTGPGQSYEQTSSGMVQLAFQGSLADQSQRDCAEGTMDRNWTGFLNANTTYGYYAFSKAMRLAYPAPIVNLPSGRDWFDAEPDGLRRTLVNRQRADGSWLSNHQLPSEPVMNTAWSTIILTPTLFENPPVAVAYASPNPGALGQAIRFDASQSYHTDPYRRIVSYAWDFDAGDGIDWSHPDATGPIASHAYGDLADYTATLRVGDDQNPPHYDVAAVSVRITIPPHPPTSVPGGPYVAAVGEPVALDGSGSYDIDAADGDAITRYGWEIDFQNPRDFDDALGAKPAGVSFPAAGTYNVGLRVTDNTSVVFPQAGRPDLTNDAYATVAVSEHCLTDLAARGKGTQVALTWTHNGSSRYTVRRSAASPSYGFADIGSTSSAYSTFIDYNVEIGKTYWYRVAGDGDCQSYAVAIVPRYRSTDRRPAITSQPVLQATEGQAYAYAVTAADPDGDVLHYYLDEAPAGMAIDEASGAIAWIPTQAQAGSQIVNVRVSDGVMSANQGFVITVAPRPNLPPAAAIAGPAAGLTGQSLAFDGSGTADPEGDLPLAYAWNFGDGALADGIAVSHAFPAAGTYVVTLFATDSRGATGTATRTVTIEEPNRPPLVAAGGPYTVPALDTLAFDGSASTDPDGDPLTFAWNFGDDSPPVAGAVARHAYAAEGTYLATLEAQDGRGGVASATVPVIVTAANHAPAASLIATTLFANPDVEVGFDASASTDADGDPLFFSWEFGDGSVTTGVQVTHRFAAPGDFAVVLTADDQRGRTDTAQVRVHVNAPPHFAAVGDRSTLEDQVFLLEMPAPDPDGDAVTYTLSEGPAGMTLDAGTGRLYWEPHNGDVGPHSVRVRAADGLGGADEAAFTLTVENVNDAPVFASSPVTAAVEQTPYLYAAAATDADLGDVITFALVSAPAGMAVDAVTGQVTWTPAHDAVGAHDVVLAARDAHGGEATQSFTVAVAEQEWPPEFTSTPVTDAVEDQPYLYPAAASDLNAADVLVFSVAEGPQGLAIDPATGRVTWTPDNAAVGPHPVRLRVSDGTLSAEQAFTLTVANTNDAPAIVSTAPAIAVVGEAYVYAVQAADPDVGDVLTYTLDAGPAGAVLDPGSGNLTWTPAAGQEGDQAFTIRASDRAGAAATQTFTVRVQATPQPPVFTSTPPTDAVQGQPYAYQAAAADPNADPLSFALVSGPAGLTVTPEGAVAFTPGPAQIGDQAVTISVTDGRFTVRQDFVISVANVNDNPVITSVPPLDGVDGVAYSYQVSAVDPDGDSLSYALTSAPAGMTVSPQGLVSWPDDGSRPDSADVEVRVEDGQGGSATQAWTIAIVPDNLPPQVSLRVSANPVAPGSFVTITVDAVDNVGVASRSLAIGGQAVVLPPSGEYQYQAGGEGDVPLSASATDLNGNTGTATFTLHVSATADSQGPQVTLSMSPSSPRVGDRISFDITASDPGGIDPERVWLLVDGKYLPVLDGHAEFVAPMQGSFTALATAYDPAGNYGEFPLSFSVSIGGSDAVLPTVRLDAPAADAKVVGAVDVAGSATDANFAYYTLSYLHHSGDDPVEFFRSDVPVSGGKLGTFDATVLEDGIYRIRLTAFDRYGNRASTEVPVEVTGYMKFGAFSLSYVDMKLRLPGLSLLAKRDYDSRDKGKGDFGYGWRLSLSSAQVDENRPAGDGWSFRDIGSFLPYFILEPTRDHDVTIVLPGGRKQEFAADAQFDDPVFDTHYGTVSFHPLAGTYAKLEILDGADFIRNGDQLLDYDFNEFDPDLYKLTLPDGTYYIIDQAAGRVTQAGDANGNVINLTPAGITHSNGASFRFDRDAQNRIIAITDESGRSCAYDYDGHGNLRSATDPEGNTTRFKYGPNHYLMEVIDPRGVRGIRTEFDDQGRVVRQISPKGAVENLQHDVAGRREVVQDFNGGVSAYDYDAQGNMVRFEDAAGNVWSYAYDANGNRTSTTNPDGGIFTTVWDAQGNKIRETDPLGNTVARTFNAMGKTLTETDPLGRVTRYTYDAAGNQLSVTGANGRVLSLKTYDASGNVLTETDGAGNATVSAYDADGNLVRRTDPLGNAVAYVHDKRGNVLRQTDARGGVTVFTYDGNDNLLSKTDPLGNVTNYTYNAIRKVAAETDPRGNTTAYEYDNYGQLARLTHPDGSFRTMEYDAKGNRISETDERGQVTAMEYDEKDHMVRKTFPDGGAETHAFDAQGNEIRVSDARGAATTYAYDQAGRMVSSANALGEETRYEYDAAGNIVAQVDGAGKRTAFEFDSLNRIVRTLGPDGAAVTFAFNDQGLHSAYGDENGNLTHFAYDARGNLTTVTDALGGVTAYAYDAAGNRIARTDALGRTTAFAYDADNRETSRTLPSGSVERTVYDSAGNVTRRIRPDGRSVDMEYDGRNRMVRKTLPGGSVRTFAYLPNGLRASMSDSSGTVEYQYDPAGRVTRVDGPGAGTLTYGYDPAGNRTSLVSAAGTIRYAYDAAGRLVSVTDPDGGTAQYGYDAAGNRISTRLPNGYSMQYAYDVRNRLVGLTQLDAAGDPIGSFTYTLDPAGRRTAIREFSGRVRSYAFDALNRLTSEALDDTGSSPDIAAAYVYDAVGNRISKTVAGTTVAYQYDDEDRLLSGDGVTWTYDANGNVATREEGGVVAQYGFDAENRLVSWQSGGSERLFAYDPDGVRIGETVDGVDRGFIVDRSGRLSQVLGETGAGGNLTAAYVHGFEPISISAGGERKYYLQDGLGSTRSLASSGGAQTDAYDYDAFGALTASSGTTPNPYLFNGQRYDAAMGHYDLRARFMDPGTGRFLSRDPAPGDPQSPLTLHPYLYAQDDPVDRVDPAGEFSTWFYGIRVHRLIGDHFVAQDPATHWSDRRLNTIVGGGPGAGVSIIFGLCRPDLIDLGFQWLYEIKPTGSWLEGRAQLLFYTYVLNAAMPGANWSAGGTYLPPTILDLGGFAFALVSPPLSGVIIYDVVDFKVLFALAAAYTISSIEVDVSMASMTAAMGFAF